MQLGPEWYLRRLGVLIRTGDQVLVTGSRVTISEQTLIMAAVVEKENRVFVLRDRLGFQVWSGWRKG